MIETTLEEAVKLCTKNGGRFRLARGSGSEFWLTVGKNGARPVVFEEDGKKLDMSAEYFESKWIYEPPKKSAFHEWADNTKANRIHCSCCFISTKQGWNALADYLKNSNIGLSQQAKQEIEKLKEP